jgi:hypothetical protein
MIARENLRSELAFLRELFKDKLPVGSNMKDVDKYFTYLEEAIDNKDLNPNDIQREEFPPDDPATSGSRVYKYHSSTQFKKLASRPTPISGQHDMDTGKDQQENLSTKSDQSPKPEDMARVQECKGTTETKSNHWSKH